MNINLLENLDELEYLRITLNNLKTVKLLQESGLHLQPLDIRADEDTVCGNEEFSDKVLKALGFRVEIEEATTERGEVYGYEIYYDPDEVMVTEIALFHPDIDSFLAWGKTVPADTNNPIAAEFSNLLMQVLPNFNICYSDYDMVELFVPLDFSSLMILETTMNWFDHVCVQGLMDLIAFCRTENAIRKEGESHDRIAVAS